MSIQDTSDSFISSMTWPHQHRLDSGNPGSQDAFNSLCVKYSSKLVVGKIIRSGVGTYDAMVTTPDHTNIPCFVLSNMLGHMNGMGTNESKIYPEDTWVLVFRHSNNLGYILGAIPPVDRANTTHNRLHDILTWEGGFSMHTDNPWNEKISFEGNAERPIDVAPGDLCYTNEFGIAFALLHLELLLKASEKAKIELFAIDDFIRIISGQYQHNAAASNILNLNDNGFNTAEMLGSQHQCEMLGIGEYKPVVEVDKYDEKVNLNCALKTKESKPYIRPRYMEEMGYLGSIYDLFILNPYEKGESKSDLATYDKDKKYQGLFHTAIDGSGRLLIRSASGICFQRCDKIPIPKKKLEAWDPTDKDKKEHKPTKKESFIWDDQHPYAKHLQLRDEFAWYTKNAYQRFIDKKSDWFLPDETMLETPEDEYEKVGEDILGKEEFNKAEYKDARSYVIMDKDGSITLRDGFGSEICMKGGNIIITCPGNLELRPGKSVVMLGGQDVIIKGKESVDISTTKQDVRIKAEKNMQLYSNDGGILIESGAEEKHTWEDKQGEDVVSSGIYLKAAKARVFIWANIVHLSSIKMMILESFKQSKSNLLMAFNTVMTTAGKILAKTKKATFFLSPSQAMLAGEGAILAGGSSVAVFKGGKAWKPLTEAEAGANPYSDISSSTDPIYTRFWEDAKAEPTDLLQQTFKIDKREKIKFTFRTAKQYGTLKPSETYKGGDIFVVYESSWSFLATSGNKFLKEVQVDTWEEKEVNKTYPWPGKENYDGDCLVSLTEEINIENDMLKTFKEIENDASGKLEKNSFNNLTVVKHT